MKKKITIALIVVLCLALLAGAILLLLPERAQHAHDYVQSLEKAASCEAAGAYLYQCECGDTYSEEIPVKSVNDIYNNLFYYMYGFSYYITSK